VLALLVAGVAITWRRALLIAVATVGALALLSVGGLAAAGDSRTHLGAFVQTARTAARGRWSSASWRRTCRSCSARWLSALLPVAVGVRRVRAVAAGPARGAAAGGGLPALAGAAARHGRVRRPASSSASRSTTPGR
jgi:hypothetical protein